VKGYTECSVFLAVLLLASAASQFPPDQDRQAAKVWNGSAPYQDSVPKS